MKKTIFRILEIFYYPIIFFISVTLGVVIGIIGKFIGNTEDLFRHIKKEYVGAKLYPEDRDERYFKALLISRENSIGKIKDYSKLRYQYEAGKLKAPPVIVANINNVILYVLFLPFSLIAGMIEGPMILFEILSDFWAIKVLKKGKKYELEKLKIKLQKTKDLVLLVEDEPDQAQNIANIIESTNDFQVVIAENGIEALKAIEKFRRFFGFANNKIKCIVLDIQMPGMNGLQFLKKLRKKEALMAYARFIPVIMLTAYEDSEKLNLSANPVLGMAAEYLKKPVDKKKLISILNKIILKNETDYLIDLNREKSYKKAQVLSQQEMEERKKQIEERRRLENLE